MSDKADLARAVELLKAGELVGIPTETVYGLGADAANPEAVAKIFAAKGRPADHPLIVHIPGANPLERWAVDIPDLAYELAEDFWPGPLTLILKRAPGVPDAVTGGQDTVGLRVPGHPLALDLLRAFAAAGGSGGIAAPSANRFGRISPTTAGHVREELGDAVALVLDGGPCTVGIESTIIDLSSGRPVLLRPGHITPAAIEAVCGVLPAAPTAAAPRASGTLEAHYAPHARVRLVPSVELAARVAVPPQEPAGGHGPGGRGAPTIAVYSRLAPSAGWLHRSMPEDAAGAARDLFAALRDLDALGVADIWVEQPPDSPDWDGVRDRLRRAAASFPAR